MIKKIYLSFLISTLCYSQSINFNEVLQQALENSKDLKKQALNIDSIKQDYNIVDGINYGKLSISSEVSRTNHAGYVFNSKLSSREATFRDFGFSQMNEGMDIIPKDLNYPNDRTNINSYVSYDIPLFMGFKIENQKDILKLQEKANELLYNLDKKNLEFEILKAYNGAVVAKDFVKALEKAKQTVEFIYEGAKEFHKNGLVTKIDVNEAKVYQLNINSTLTEAKNNFNLALAYLKYLTSNENITDVENLENIYFDLKNFDELYNSALETRDEVKMQNITIEANKKNIDVQKGSYYPTVFSHLEYGVNDDRFTASKDKDYYIALVGISLTLFDSSRSAYLEKSKIEHLKSTLDYEKLKDGIKLELEKAILDYKAKQEILKEKIEAKNLAFEVLNQANLQYKNRLISMTTLLSQEANFRKSESMLINARYENSLALAKLNLVLGQNLNKDEK
ncbi:TolC family protein [Aliarcobacter butzleri]|uniref:TolC family protein n=1 Tax=Aliarcobacter butzleri TaxID=28197 RepID=UPI001EDC7C51|nr:TolC family protein [Aliarcobacter butzleri]MCG3677846.1 TolC family protein [Aliarcobacter butzleri]MCT7638149.1 TolC family protein [Aliarcobacter butzleri]MDN5049082.1 TolC family protein [Aliarcobacter butzleri]MDN5055928.1 TolC family protein [Aliarcobacter butzleri]MDN5111229.1 TolC family protein [Aliarcobacter butzleri]